MKGREKGREKGIRRRKIDSISSKMSLRIRETTKRATFRANVAASLSGLSKCLGIKCNNISCSNMIMIRLKLET